MAFNRETLQDEITGYAGDTVHALRLQAVATPEVIMDALCTLVKHTEDSQVFASACSFAQDIILYASLSARSETENAFVRAGFAGLLAQRLFGANYWIRDSAAYTLGKLNLPGSGIALMQAFHQFRDIDPLLLPRLVLEAGWCQAAEQEVLLAKLVESPCWLSRWCVLEDIQWEVGETETARMHLVHQLAQDTVGFVAEEARFLLRKARFLRETRELPRPERRRLGKALNAEEPFLTWKMVRLRFEQQLSQSRKSDYTVGELEAFVVALPPG